MPTAKGLNQILLVGDSLTEYGGRVEDSGWAITLNSLYTRKMDVVNRGFTGYTTEWVKHILPQLLPPEQGSSSNVALVIVFLGANDSVLAPNTQHTPLEKYKKNLEEMYHTVKRHSSYTRFLLIAPPPFNDGAWEETCAMKGRSRDRDPEQTALYSRACLEVACELSVPVVDLWNIFTQDPRPPQDLFSDGLHMTRSGNRVILAAVVDMIKRTWPDLDPLTLPPILSHWSSVNLDNLEDAMQLPENTL
ncbi:SGNH hydrolase-type esterase domain-containing protein [Piptocephalis cylindrospora]|uniref:SGNH hydrolase-type esterase domain-containing protein n=1 Tax=Piptocephalis cylindrospora TaxID=1907219 RepID=A0A4P9Y6R9_9FUNG|nr:SGNH hydrolase-type esterase domain-containing protein [Piptocephalis cylindrospora]|eukprot:RKP13921.1 SGNH hydrolase-type esterase domain-containing protein [Piptocephalis cylindrospora]